MSLEPSTLLAIAAMAIVTYATRIGGFWIVRFVPVAGRWRAALEAVPAAVLMSVIAPMVFMTGPAESIAAAVTLLAAMRLPLIVAVIAGVVSVVMLRMAIG